MSAEIHPLSKAELSRLGTVKGKIAKFDLSRVLADQFDALLVTLKDRGTHEFTGIGLNFDLLKKTKQVNEKTQQRKSETKTSRTRATQGSFTFSQSAMNKRKDVTAKIAKTIADTLMITDSLAFLKFRAVSFKPAELEVLCNAIYRCDTLRVLHFCDVPMGDSGFSTLTRALKRKGIIDLQCRKCGLTDACGVDLHSLVSYQVSVQTESQWLDSLSARRPVASPLVCMQLIDLRDNDLTYVFIREVYDSLLDLPLKVFDLRGNPGITGTLVTSLIKDMPDTKIRTGLSKPIKGSKPAKKPYSSKIGRTTASAASSTTSARKRASSVKTLKRENVRLKNLVGDLESGDNIVEIEPDLAIVGPRARELANHLIALDQMIEKMHLGPSFLHDTSISTAAKKKVVKKRRQVC